MIKRTSTISPTHISSSMSASSFFRYLLVVTLILIWCLCLNVNTAPVYLLYIYNTESRCRCWVLIFYFFTVTLPGLIVCWVNASEGCLWIVSNNFCSNIIKIHLVPRPTRTTEQGFVDFTNILAMANIGGFLSLCFTNLMTPASNSMALKGHIKPGSDWIRIKLPLLFVNLYSLVLKGNRIQKAYLRTIKKQHWTANVPSTCLFI